MTSARRQGYLAALGVDAWRLRAPAAAADALPTGTAAPDLVLAVAARPDATRPAAAPPEAAQLGMPHAPVEHDAPQRAASREAAYDWAPLRERVAACTRCSLSATRTQTVFGVGNPQADWLVVGEAPGAEEDQRGEPFVGRAGQLLNSMLRAIGLRREQVYIANVLKCRPPRNRDPQPGESAECLPFLERQIALLEPKIMLVVGRIAAQTLLRTATKVGDLRQKVHVFGTQRVPMVVTYHPAYLLRSPAEKRRAWEDFKFAREVFARG
jgi:DNA polymerase